MSRFIFTHSNRFGLLLAPRSKLPSGLRKCHTFLPILRAIQQKSSRHSIPPNPSARNPEFPSLRLISSFQDLRHQFSRFYPCKSLWHLWILRTVLWIPPCSLYSFLCLHSWTMTCSVCLCQTIACLCSCVRCSLVEKRAPPHLKHPSRGLDDPFPLPDERELTASTSMGSESPREAVSLGLQSRILKPKFANTNVTTSRRASSNVRRRCQLDLAIHLILQHLLAARHVGLPAFNPCLEFQNRAPSQRNDRSQEVSFPSSFCRSISLLQPPPCLPRVFPRVGKMSFAS